MRLRFGQGKRGLSLTLHELETAVMECVWSRGWARFSVADVLEVLRERRDIAYTTVMTTVARLHDKGLLARRRDGRRYLYAPRMTRETYLETTAREVLDRAVDVPQAMSLLADKVGKASAPELDRLEALIRRRRKELGT